jgi:hypothetical protein
VHEGLTYVVARAAGFSTSQAATIARADQGVDEDPDTEPFSSHAARRDYHFTTQGRRDQMWGAFASTGSLKSLGVFFHAQQDSFSHAGFGPTKGHLSAGHAPDKTYTDPAKAFTMAANTYRLMNAAADKLGIPKSDRVAWKQIRGALVTFNLREHRRIRMLPCKRCATSWTWQKHHDA